MGKAPGSFEDLAVDVSKIQMDATRQIISSEAMTVTLIFYCLSLKAFRRAEHSVIFSSHQYRKKNNYVVLKKTEDLG